jgi:hypothetical protein
VVEIFSTIKGRRLTDLGGKLRGLEVSDAELQQEKEEESSYSDYKNTIYIVVVFTLTFAFIARDWRKRQWT